MMINNSKAHLKAAGESYFEHMRYAATVGMLAIGAGVAGLIHAVIPGLCTGTASATIRRISRLLDERGRLAQTREEAGELLAFVMLLLLAALVCAPLWALPVAGIIKVAYTALAFAIPLTLLLVNRELGSEISDRSPRLAVSAQA
jgi:hypothetical protein